MMEPMSAAPGRFDALLTQLAQQHGGVESLLDSFFDFLHRKTDFYVVSTDPAKHKMGFLPGQAQQKVLQAFQKYPMKSLDGKNGAVESKAKSTGKIAEKSESEKLERKVTVAEAKPQLTAEGKQVPVGNGGVAANYTWTQTLEDVSIHMELAQGTRAKDLTCRIETTRLSVALKSDPTKPILEGELPEKIRADESIWSLEGGPEIDTSKVDSRRNIQEYDEATQGAIRKAVYDQRQQQLHGNIPLTPEERIMEEAKDLPGSPFLPSAK